MLRQAQILVLDQPTNDLDLATLSVLEDTLTEFDGAVLLVSHDRYFVDRVATTILAFDDAGCVVPFASLLQWEAWRAEAAAARERASASARSAGGPPAPADGARARKRLGYLEQREYDAIEGHIATAEAELREVIAASEHPDAASDASRLVELLAVVEQKRAEVDRLYARWSELEAKIAVLG
jgi:ATP-binding cassette subfamily F protein uup